MPATLADKTIICMTIARPANSQDSAMSLTFFKLFTRPQDETPNLTGFLRNTILGPVVQKVDNAIHWIKISIQWIGAIGFPNTYLLDSDLSDG